MTFNMINKCHSLTIVYTHCMHTPFLLRGGGGGGLNLQQNFQKGDFIGPQLLKGGLLGIRGDFFQGWGEGGGAIFTKK